MDVAPKSEPVAEGLPPSPLSGADAGTGQRRRDRAGCDNRTNTGDRQSGNADQ